MNQKFEEALISSEKLLSNLSCDFAEIRLSSGVNSIISLSKSATDSISTGETIAGSVRVLKKGSLAFVTFNDILNVENFLKRALESSEKINQSESTVFYKMDSMCMEHRTSAEIDFDDVSMDEKFDLLSRYNRILGSHEHIQSTKAIYKESNQDYAYLNSEGSVLKYRKKYCGVSLTSVAKKGILIQPFHNSISGFGGYEIVKGLESEAEAVVKTSVDMLEAVPVEGGRYSVILDPKLSGVFIHEAFGHLSEADFIHENTSLRKKMELGRRFGPDELNVIDDGTLEQYSGFIPFDDEGIAPEKTDLIKNGILSGRLHSRETAAKMEEAPTGNGRAMGVMKEPIVRMTNTYIDNGTSEVSEIFDSIDNGIYALDVIGGQTNLEMFTFSSAYAYEIKNGKKGRMLRDVILSGNVFSTLGNISMIGDDCKMFGGLGGCGKSGQGPLPVSFGGPHILIDDVLVGGKE